MTSDTVAALKAAREAIDRALLMLEEKPSRRRAVKPVIDAAPDDWTTVQKAAGELGVHVETLKRQARQNGFGICAEGSRLRVERNRMRAWREGRPFERLGDDM